MRCFLPTATSMSTSSAGSPPNMRASTPKSCRDYSGDSATIIAGRGCCPTPHFYWCSNGWNTTATPCAERGPLPITRAICGESRTSGESAAGSNRALNMNPRAHRRSRPVGPPRVALERLAAAGQLLDHCDHPTRLVEGHGWCLEQQAPSRTAAARLTPVSLCERPSTARRAKPPCQRLHRGDDDARGWQACHGAWDRAPVAAAVGRNLGWGGVVLSGRAARHQPMRGRYR